MHFLDGIFARLKMDIDALSLKVFFVVAICLIGV
jgi:hypothetical protein